MSHRPSPVRRTTAAVAGVLVGSAVLVPAALPAGAAPPITAGGAASQVEAPVPEIDWAACGEGLEAFECASVQVPTDYDDVDGPTTTIALTRLPAQNPDEKIGTVFTNPGGPGGSGVDFIQGVGPTLFTPEVYQRFDVLGFDPRGVGQSDPATCYPTAEQEAAATAGLLAFPTTEAEQRTYLSQNLRLASACRRQSPDRFAHASTANVARDMDLLRQAVGDEQLTYSGVSYGTMLGATYSMLFPDRVRALSLDGTVLPQDFSGEIGAEQAPVGARLNQAAGGTESFEEFLRLCAEAGPEGCSLAELGDPAVVADAIFDGLRETPVQAPLPDGTTVTLDFAITATLVFQGLYDPIGFPDLADLLATVAVLQAGGNVSPTEVAPGAARVLERSHPDRARRGEDYASLGGAYAALCADSGTTGRPFDYAELIAEDLDEHPIFGGRAWTGLPCEYLRTPDADAYTGPWEQTTTAPVLVTGTRFDPSTPYASTRPYAELYPDASVLTVEGWGHTVIGKSACATGVISDYLVDPGQPVGETTCGQDRSPFDPLPPGSPAPDRMSTAPSPVL